MRYLQILTFHFLFLLTASIVAQDAFHQRLLEQLEEDYGIVGGEWALSSNEFTTMGNIFYWGLSDYTIEDTEGQIFTRSVSATVNELADNPWNSGIGIINNQPIEAGDRLLMAVWMRGTTAQAEGAFTQLFFEDAETYEKETGLSARLSKEWKLYLVPFESKRDYDYWEAQIAWHLNFRLQTVEVGGLALLNYKKNYELHQLPEEIHLTYEGRDADAPWRTAANERINTHRKANLEIKVIDENGKLIPNASVSIRMQSHDYQFGTSIEECAIAGNNCQENTYQEKLLNLDGKGHGFNAVAFEEALQWSNWEAHSANTPEQISSAIQWLTDQNIAVYGGSLILPSWENMPNDLLANAEDVDYLKTRIDQHLEDILKHPVVAENIREWEVLQEPVWNRSLEFALAGKGEYSTGRELYAEIFKKARQESPEMIAYLNDCVAFCEDHNNNTSYNNLKAYIQEIIEAGAQIDGIGFQAHIGSTPIAPETIYNILEDFDQTFGLKAKITEFDMVQMSQSLSADYMRDFLTIVFSHPSTEGFLMNGFWDGKHALEDAPLYDQNWNLKPSGQSFMDLVFKEWWTKETNLTDENGEVGIRAFKGEYEILVTFNNETYSTPLQLKADETLVIELPIATNIEEIERQNRFMLFPNPSNGVFQLQYDFPQNSELQLEVYDLLGRKLQVFSKNVLPQKMFLHSFELQSGAYFVKVRDGQRIMIEKIVVH